MALDGKLLRRQKDLIKIYSYIFQTLIARRVRQTTLPSEHFLFGNFTVHQINMNRTEAQFN